MSSKKMMFLVVISMCGMLRAADPPVEPPAARSPFDAEAAKSHQQQWADYLGLPVEVMNSIGMRFVLIPPGEFVMGSPSEEQNEHNREQQHNVKITRPFYLCIHEVTRANFHQVMGVDQTAPRTFPGRPGDKPMPSVEPDDRPVWSVNWQDAAEFCRTLSALREERSTGRAYRLPTEAEWEYACRAGTTTTFHFGNAMNQALANVGNFGKGLTSVGSYPPNAFGLYDMHGNAIEWCNDIYDKDFYARSPLEDPQGPPGPALGGPGLDRVARGGGFVHEEKLCRAGCRLAYGAVMASFAIGFRAAMDLSPESVRAAKATQVSFDQLLAQAQEALARQDNQRAIVLGEDALSMSPDNREVLQMLARAHQSRALSLASRFRRDSANVFLVRSSDCARRGWPPGMSLELSEQQFLRQVLYNEACARAMMGEQEKALGCLREAIEAGHDDLAEVEGDADLEPLRALPAYHELVAATREKLRAQARQDAHAALAEHQPFEFAFRLPDLKGQTIGLDDFNGKVVVVDFWGTWCPPCRKQVPHLVALHTQYQEAGLQVVGINYELVKESERAEMIERFIAQNNIAYPCVVGDSATQKQLPGGLGYPTTVFLDRQGTVRLKVTGYQTFEFLEAVVLELLGQDKAEK